MDRPPRVVFMGTPDFAVPCLNALLQNGCDVAMVVTQPDRRKGRGTRLCCPPVKDAVECLDTQCRLLQPPSVKNEAVAEDIRQAAPDLIVVVAFGQLLPREILEIPPFGAINVHASLLPRYRGPAPIQWAIINGETRTGITTMQMDAGLDTGDVLLTAETPIHPDDTAETLHERLSHIGAETLIRTLRAIEAGTLKPTPQNHGEATYAPMLSREDGRIDWHGTAVSIERRIRGVTPWPGAFTFLDGKRLKIFKAQVIDAACAQEPGTVVQGFEGELRVATGKGLLSILELQGASGKRMVIGDFLRGRTICVGSRLGA